MQVTVFGATGGIGRHVVDQLLTAGHDVVAYARNPAKLDRHDPRLRLVTGELADHERVREGLEGSNAVISALGPSLKRGTTGTPVADGTRTIVEAMQATGVRRFIGLATPSIADPRDKPTLKARILPILANLMFPNALRELQGMTQAVTDSGLDWTIARITNPTNKNPTGTTRDGYLGVDDVGSAMTRTDIAAFLVGQLTDTTYQHAAPAISN
ncbi:putative NAD(P)-binding protein [Kribbella sp. VKM Ac-2527]|uniref:Putative NAD(P)-binding protein n=1 Tax=Kribbella caucasensis TaxID=2512215 RepID=A0A4R6IYA3_9ACTN|nr:NAD(P)H-binding protein [Kribbella sp. VKM Ac-2527]TDO27790.1 putative NAD(P)-binding protein [Kribbella sp. VKM Ac-2527]